jgi:hypothetical protein
MPLAYHLLAHKDPDQVARLIRVLQHPEDTFVLHFDRRAPRALHELGHRLAAESSNVLVQRPRAVIWGGPAISELQIEAMDLALRQPRPWHHFVNLTGQDFPLVSREERLARLGARPGANYLSWFKPLETSHWANARERLDRWHLHSAGLAWLLAVPGAGRRLRALLGWTNRIPTVPGWRRPWPAGFPYRGGSNYVVLSRDACAEVARSAGARALRHWLRRAAHPDEIVFQSILLNSPLAATVINDDLREIDFPPHAPHPRVFTMADWPRLNASTRLFARKFDASVDSEILDRLEARVLNHR